jgi:hypothetical protein
MAFQIDPSISLQAQRTTFDPASILMQAQQNSAALEKHRFEMQKLREDYDAQKEARKQQKAMQMGIASDLAGIQSGTPAQYAPMTYQQTPQRGQMPMGMTGVLASERGQNMPQPKLFGEDLMSGNYQLGGGEVTQEAVAGRQPTYPEMLAIGLKHAMLAQDDKKIMEYAKELQEIKKQSVKFGMNPTKGINPQTGQPEYFVVNELGQKQFLGVNPYETPKDAKAPVTWTVPNGRKETTYGYDANGKQIVLGVKNLDKPEPLEDSTNSFTPEAIDNAAARYNIDGTLPPMGMGKGGSAARSQILNRAAELASGTSGTDQRVDQLTTKASASTLLQLKKTKTMIKAFEEMATKNADIALQMSAKVDRSGVPVVNRWYLAGNNKLRGDVDTATFNTAVNVFANEYAKIMSGSMGNTPVSDSARKEAHEILNTAQTPEQLRANIKLLQREMKNRLIGLDESEAELIQQMKGGKKEDAHGSDKKDPYKITKGMSPKYVDYLMAHKQLVEMKDYEGAKILTEMYLKGGAK